MLRELYNGGNPTVDVHVFFQFFFLWSSIIFRSVQRTIHLCFLVTSQQQQPAQHYQTFEKSPLRQEKKVIIIIIIITTTTIAAEIKKIKFESEGQFYSVYTRRRWWWLWWLRLKVKDNLSDVHVSGAIRNLYRDTTWKWLGERTLWTMKNIYTYARSNEHSFLSLYVCIIINYLAGTRAYGKKVRKRGWG